MGKAGEPIPLDPSEINAMIQPVDGVANETERIMDARQRQWQGGN